ncbi:MAG: RNA polymerase sigma factor [Chloroflexota bacterium]|nr:sigma-70 family RNA polymerase sigma factor [Chloroflexota bacterium]NOG64361.1 sigma-70 family RNA polymerase sigma factor [Chloroflexota bacterium]GIK66882.1 MAG: RNA polymerase sigma factor [Chloroflexota bacterium]
MATNTTSSLLERAQRREPDAVAELYRLYVQSIARYIGYRIPDVTVVEDLTAEVFLRMVESLPRYRATGAPFEAWLYRIAAAQVANYYRHHQRHPQTSLNEAMGSESTPVEFNVQKQQEIHELRAALTNLSDEQRTILFLRFVERKSHQETAYLLGKTVEAIATAQHRALKQLAKLLGTERSDLQSLSGEAS